MHLAPVRRWLSRPPFLIVLLLLPSGCMLDAPRPAPAICSTAENGCSGPDAPWYNQNVTAMIPPPPVEPPTAAPAATTAATQDAVPSAAVAHLTDPTLPPSSTIAPPDVAATTAPIDQPKSTPAPDMEAMDRTSSATVKTRKPETVPVATPEAAIRDLWSVPADRLFAPGSPNLRVTGAAELDALADRLHGSRYERVVVVAHTDRSGNEITNLKLSWQRARAVRDHLESRGIPDTALDHEGRGARDAHIDPRRCPVKPLARLRCQAPDRRIEILVTRGKAP